jgi:hypothetical protein
MTEKYAPSTANDLFNVYYVPLEYMGDTYAPNKYEDVYFLETSQPVHAREAIHLAAAVTRRVGVGRVWIVSVKDDTTCLHWYRGELIYPPRCTCGAHHVTPQHKPEDEENV